MFAATLISPMLFWRDIKSRFDAILGAFPGSVLDGLTNGDTCCLLNLSGDLFGNRQFEFGDESFRC